MLSPKYYLHSYAADSCFYNGHFCSSIASYAADCQATHIRSDYVNRHKWYICGDLVDELSLILLTLHLLRHVILEM